MSEANENNNINDTEGKETNNQEETNESSNSNVNTNESTKQKVVKKRNMTNIQMLNENEKFNIVEEANNLFPKISLSQLLSASPSIRKELEQGCCKDMINIFSTLINLFCTLYYLM